MLKTSYFARSAREPRCGFDSPLPATMVYSGEYFRLAPTPEMLKLGDWEEYQRRYREEILSGLDPDEISGT